MKTFILLLLACLVAPFLSFTGKKPDSYSFYIVRHAEKGSSTTQPTDPPLSAEGGERAQALRDLLLDKKVQVIYATPTQRAMSTAGPLSEALKVSIENYGPFPDAAFVEKLRSAKKSALIVGHSNTVDDIVNALAGEAKISDLPDNAYDNLYIVTYEGDKVSFEARKYGKGQ
ncbi:MAG TPA: histidine phosphatase family protein [Flavisolibacter sp.]|nr:histidine phosphatase family protein [Flavisolibacter sp.]